MEKEEKKMTYQFVIHLCIKDSFVHFATRKSGNKFPSYYLGYGDICLPIHLLSLWMSKGINVI